MKPSLIERTQREADNLWDCISTRAHDAAFLSDLGFRTNERPSAIYVVIVAPAVHPSLGKRYFLGPNGKVAPQVGKLERSLEIVVSNMVGEIEIALSKSDFQNIANICDTGYPAVTLCTSKEDIEKTLHTLLQEGINWWEFDIFSQRKIANSLFFIFRHEPLDNDDWDYLFS